MGCDGEVALMLLVRLVRRWPLLSYFLVAYAASAGALAVIGWPRFDGTNGRPVLSLIMFPLIVVTVGLAGLVLTSVCDGSKGLRQLRSQMTRWRLGRWWFVLFVPPLGIVGVLSALRVFISPTYAPQFLALGILAGIVAGFFQEIGWTGFAYPRMRARTGALGGAILLGVLWAAWHFPVVDSLGVASPHGPALPAFFASFVALLVAMRVLIAWLYINTGSLLGAQMLHASSTGFLVVLGAPAVSAAQEALWYLVYAGVLWVMVGVVVATFGRSLTGRRQRSGYRAPDARASQGAATT
jgi:membrane protease YdiL (CAAX protease family)